MKLRGTKDLSVATVGKYGTLQEFSFFDKVSICPFLPSLDLSSAFSMVVNLLVFCTIYVSTLKTFPDFSGIEKLTKIKTGGFGR